MRASRSSTVRRTSRSSSDEEELVAVAAGEAAGKAVGWASAATVGVGHIAAGRGVAVANKGIAVGRGVSGAPAQAANKSGSPITSRTVMGRVMPGPLLFWRRVFDLLIS
jgi:hypothetical protein